MSDRTEIPARVAGSLRLEGLQAGPEMRDLLERWARGEATDDDLRAAERRILAGASRDGRIAAGASRAA